MFFLSFRCGFLVFGSNFLDYQNGMKHCFFFICRKNREGIQNYKAYFTTPDVEMERETHIFLERHFSQGGFAITSWCV